MENIAEGLGLTETEYNVYMMLLRSGKSLAGLLIKKLNLHRATVYDVLNRLMEKGLVSYVLINDKKYFSATSPEKLNDLIGERREEFEEKARIIHKVVEELSHLKPLETKKHIASIYEGKDGLKTIMQDILLTKKDFCVLGGEIGFMDLLPVYTKHWAKERERLGLYAKRLSTGFLGKSWKYNIDKQISKEYSLPTSTIIYDDKVAVFINDEPLTIILIESKTVAKTYLNHFNLLWNMV